ncbi:hypothetical protein [Alkalicoccobacillus plakortidis]|uniref:Uncharacterized protein n=1 Tax=Alkalicoccobacillus plakortidis TaxID=444060 RepID=A0ABT0XIM4_9BACI|nr:hypothetical protein [Alkalicoccobacillus plakortidis]MCM2675756.1 hypothetical protein [Alkalicoccobacillus plakortidis]
MSTSRIFKWITGGGEAILAIPVLGGAIVMSTYWTILLVMLGLHITTLILSNKDRGDTHASILGIVTSCVAWIPFVGFVMHLITAILLLVNAGKRDPASATEMNGPL